MRVYVDSCVLIYRLEAPPVLREAARAALASLGPGDVPCVSDLSRLECLVKPLRTSNAVLRAAHEKQFAEFELLPLPAAVFDLAAELRATSSLKTPDALHAACAIHHGCAELWTNDNRLAALAGRIATRIVR
jgi:predicted nucleic acid-binding protein